MNTTSLEKRFNLKSSEVGWVSSAYDVSAGIMVIPVSYFGSQTHKPRVVAIAALLLAIGSIIMSIPHFATGNYEFGEGGDVCMPSGRIYVSFIEDGWVVVEKCSDACFYCYTSGHGIALNISKQRLSRWVVYCDDKY